MPFWFFLVLGIAFCLYTYAVIGFARAPKSRYIVALAIGVVADWFANIWMIRVGRGGLMVHGAFILMGVYCIFLAILSFIDPEWSNRKRVGRIGMAAYAFWFLSLLLGVFRIL